VDVVFRYLILGKKATVEARVLPGDVIKISFNKTFNYEAGQYVFIMIPKMNVFEFHPFSLSSCPSDATTCIHIRALGDWTKRLKDYVEKSSIDQVSEVKSVSLDIRIEGPYGSPSINLNSPKYEVCTYRRCM
jgi:predicted ferric reductase